VERFGARPMNRTAVTQRAHIMRELVETLLFIGLVLFIFHFTVQTFSIPDTSMQPALNPNQLVIVNKAAYWLASPQRGDVVLFVDPSDPHLQREYIERVIAVPGDTITITPTSVEVDGVTLHEPYVQVPYGVTENPIVVNHKKLGPNQYWLMDDSRVVRTPDGRLLQADDSRDFGPVDRSNIRGKAVLVFWPLSQIHGISTYSSVFSGLHQ